MGTTSRLRALGGAGLGLAGLAVLVALRVATADQPLDAVPAPFLDGLTLALSVLIESLPFIVLGITLSVVVQIWIPQSWLFRILPSHPVPRRFVISLLGMFLPVCECGNVPLARGLVSRGYSVSDSMVFLLAAPIINPVTIITTHQAFGFDDGILVARIIGAIVIANVLAGSSPSTPTPNRCSPRGLPLSVLRPPRQFRRANSSAVHRCSCGNPPC